jgi:hypothetical protein
MHSFHKIEEWRLVVVKFTEPFSGSDIVEVARELPIPGPGADQHIGILVDLRSVDVSKLSASYRQRSVAIRKTRILGHPAEPLAFLLKDLRERGTVRLHNQWAEDLGLREENITFATASFGEALG